MRSLESDSDTPLDIVFSVTLELVCDKLKPVSFEKCGMTFLVSVTGGRFEPFNLRYQLYPSAPFQMF